jgi:hypothetical protein
MSRDAQIIQMSKEEREKYYEKNYFSDLATTVKEVADGSPFYRKICEKADYMFEEELNYDNLHLVPYIQTNHYKEHLELFPQLTRVPEDEIEFRTISTSTSGNPSIVARTKTDIEFLQTASVDGYIDFLWWNTATWVFNFVPSKFTLKMVTKRSTSQKKAMMFVYFFNQPWETHINNVYMVTASILRNLWYWISHFTTESIIHLQTKKLQKTIENRTEDDFILLGGNTILIYNVGEKLFKEKGITFNLGEQGGVGTGGGGWDGIKGQIQSKPFSKAELVEKMDEIFGIPMKNMHDIYAFTESPAIFSGHYSKKHEDQILHTPPYAKIIVRDPETLEPVKPGETGVLEVLTPYGVNGNSSCAILVDDLVKLIGDNDSTCSDCGYKGAHFIHKGRQSPPDGKSCSSILDFFDKIR